MRMPEPDASVIARRSEIAARLQEIIPGDGVITDADELRVYECDGLTAYHQTPLLVVLPETTEQVARVLRYCDEAGVEGGAARRRDLAVGRGAAARRRDRSRHGQVQPHPRPRSRQPLRRRPARRDQPGDHRRRAEGRLLLRPRSLEPDRLHHRPATSRRIRAASIA